MVISKMKNLNQSQLITVTFVSLVCLSVPISIFGLWIYAFDLGNSQTERVAIFNDYFPDFLHGRWDITFLSIAFSIAAIAFSSIGLRLSKMSWKALNIIIIIFSSLLLLLNLFMMM